MRLIDADALAANEQAKYEAVHNVRPMEVQTIMHRAIQGALAGAPTIDAVPVVRCKDCVYAEKEEDILTCRSTAFGVKPDDYCSDGERRSE